MNLTEELKLVKSQNKHCHLFKAVFQESATWDQFLEYINRTENVGHHLIDRQGFHVFNQVTLSQISHFKNADIFYKEAYDGYNGNIHDPSLSMMLSELYRNISDKTGLNTHSDQADTVHWQCLGASYWWVYDENDQVTEYLVEPGDIVYVKANFIHRVQSITPRASLAFSAIEKY